MNLVRLPLDELEELVKAIEPIVAVQDDVDLLGSKQLEWDIDRHSGLPSDSQEVLQILAPPRKRPRLNRPLFDALVRIRNDQVHIDSDRPSKPLTLRTRTDRIVEGEHSRIRIVVAQSVVRALVVAGETKHLCALEQIHKCIPVSLDEGCFKRIGQSFLALLVASPYDKPVDENKDVLLALSFVFRLIKIDDPAVHEDPEESSLFQSIELLCDGMSRMIVHGKCNEDSRTIRFASQPLDGARDDIALHLLSTNAAICPPDATEKQPEVVIDFGGGGDGRAGIPS